MAIASKIKEHLKGSSLIRLVADEGLRLRQESSTPVWDLSLGNPVLEPPAVVRESLLALLQQPSPGIHRYMPNNGHIAARTAIARSLQKELGWSEIAPDHVILTVGAAGAICLTLKILLDPGDEVIVVSPYFVEYQFYVDAHQGVPVVVPSTDTFQLDLAAMEQALTPKTKAVMINTPNNPTGVAYNHQSLSQLAALLRQHQEKTGRVVYLINDSPYRYLMFDETKYADPLCLYDHTIFITSFSKTLSIPGERIGYAFFSPRCDDVKNMIAAMAFASRVMGFVNAPALMQHIIPSLVDIPAPVAHYHQKLKRIAEPLLAMGYDMVWPDGAFYLFPKAPGGDDLAFYDALKEHRTLVVPGSGFGKPGYFRISFCGEDAVIDGALPAFQQVIRRWQ